MVTGEGYQWNTIRSKKGRGPWYFPSTPFMPPQLDGWHLWNYSGKGPRWPCYNCRLYFRQLVSNWEPSTDISYGVTGNLPPVWQRFDYRWYCMDCVRVLGIVW